MVILQRRQFLTGKNELYLLAGEGFAFDEGLRQFIKFRHVLLQETIRVIFALLDDGVDLLIDYLRRPFTVVAVLRYLPSQKYLFIPLAECDGTEFFAHAPFANGA